MHRQHGDPKEALNRHLSATYGLGLFLMVYFGFPIIPFYLGSFFGPSNPTAGRILTAFFYPLQFLIEHSELYRELFLYEMRKFGLIP